MTGTVTLDIARDAVRPCGTAEMPATRVTAPRGDIMTVTAPVGLSRAQQGLYDEIARFGPENQGPDNWSTGTSKTVRRTLAVLERRGLVNVWPDIQDGRRRYAALPRIAPPEGARLHPLTLGERERMHHRSMRQYDHHTGLWFCTECLADLERDVLAQGDHRCVTATPAVIAS